MINAKKLIKLDWQPNRGKRSNVADKGHFVVDTTDNIRYVVPLAYLSNLVFKELLNLSKEFGLSSDGPLTLPCDSVFMKSLISFLESQGLKDLEKDLLCLITSNRCWSFASLQSGHNNQHLPVMVFKECNDT